MKRSRRRGSSWAISTSGRAGSPRGFYARTWKAPTSARTCGGRGPIRGCCRSCTWTISITIRCCGWRSSTCTVRERRWWRPTTCRWSGNFRGKGKGTRRSAKKKMVPSDPIPSSCSPPACTALSTAIESAGRFASLLPEGRFRRPQDQCFQRAATFSRSGPVARNGLSLACNGSRFRGLHSRVNVPGLLLRVQAERFRSPFGLSAPPPIPVRPGSGRLIASGPLPLPLRLDLPLPRPPLPFGTFTSLRIKAFYRICCQSARLPNPPDLLSLPAAVSITSSASDQRSRFATFPEACCSSNLLEPPSLCSRSHFASILFCVISAAFPQCLFRFVLNGLAVAAREFVWIKRGRVVCFAILAACADSSSGPARSAISSSPCRPWSACDRLSGGLDRRPNVPLVASPIASGRSPPPASTWSASPTRRRALMEELRGFDSIVSWYGANRAEFRDAVAGLPFTFFPALPRATARFMPPTSTWSRSGRIVALRDRRHPADPLRGRARETSR